METPKEMIVLSTGGVVEVFTFYLSTNLSACLDIYLKHK